MEKKLDTKNFEDKKKWFEVLKGVANKHNYDSFIYKNDYEFQGVAEEALEDSYMLLEPDQAKGLFGGRTSGEPEFMKSKGGLI